MDKASRSARRWMFVACRAQECLCCTEPRQSKLFIFESFYWRVLNKVVWMCGWGSKPANSELFLECVCVFDMLLWELLAPSPVRLELLQSATKSVMFNLFRLSFLLLSCLRRLTHTSTQHTVNTMHTHANLSALYTRTRAHTHTHTQLSARWFSFFSSKASTCVCITQMLYWWCCCYLFLPLSLSPSLNMLS